MNTKKKPLKVFVFEGSSSGSLASQIQHFIVVAKDEATARKLLNDEEVEDADEELEDGDGLELVAEQSTSRSGLVFTTDPHRP